MKCDICGREEAEWICNVCDNKMVCSDCDQKWHQHPKRRSHQREPLKSSQRPDFVSSISSGPSSVGSFTRTSSTQSIRLEDSLPPVNGTVVNDLKHHNVDADPTPLLPEINEPLKSTDTSSVLQRTELLPRSVTEINEDLSYRSLLGVNDSLVTEQHNSSKQNAHHYRPSVVPKSSSKQLISITSDFQSTLQNLQSMVEEVNSSIISNGTSGSRDRGVDDWNLSLAVYAQSAANKHPELSSKRPHSAGRTATELKSRQSVARSADEKQHAVDADAELTMLVAQAKYPPNMGVSGSSAKPPAEYTKPLINKQDTAHMKPQNAERSAGIEKPVFNGMKDVMETKGAVQSPAANGSSTYLQHVTGARSNLSDSGHYKIQSSANQQRSPQTFVKQRLSDVPGVVHSRVGDGQDLRVLQRTSAGNDSDYHSKFTDIHDEVWSCWMLYFGIIEFLTLAIPKGPRETSE